MFLGQDTTSQGFLFSGSRLQHCREISKLLSMLQDKPRQQEREREREREREIIIKALVAYNIRRAFGVQSSAPRHP